jgi:hypothetical protein
MLSDDVYRTRLAATYAMLKAAAAPFADIALIDSAATPDFARLSLIPNAAGACAVEIMLRADQLYDISLATEFYEDCPVTTFDLFEPLILAVTRGDVLQRRHLSAATGAERGIETIVSLPGGVVWTKGHVHSDVAAAIADERTLFQDRRFVPYRR